MCCYDTATLGDDTKRWPLCIPEYFINCYWHRPDMYEKQKAVVKIAKEAIIQNPAPYVLFFFFRIHMLPPLERSKQGLIWASHTTETSIVSHAVLQTVVSETTVSPGYCRTSYELLSQYEQEHDYVWLIAVDETRTCKLQNKESHQRLDRRQQLMVHECSETCSRYTTMVKYYVQKKPEMYVVFHEEEQCRVMRLRQKHSRKNI